MTRQAKPQRRFDAADLMVAVAIVSLTIGAALAWLPAGFVVFGLALVAIVRFGTEAP
jgi:hypothetical protein